MSYFDNFKIIVILKIVIFEKYSKKLSYSDCHIWKYDNLLYFKFTRGKIRDFFNFRKVCQKYVLSYLRNFQNNCHIANCHILKILKFIVILKLSYKNMTIFANCHIFLKIVIFAKYDKKKTYVAGTAQHSIPISRKAPFKKNPL